MVRVWLACLAFLALVTAAPIVANRVGKQLAIFSEVGCSEGRREFLGCLVLRLGVLVPDDDCTFAAIRRESVVLGVECDAVHSVDISTILLLDLLAVALEAKVCPLAFVRLIYVIVLNAAATFD